MQEIKISIEGMSCQHCISRVKRALDAVPGVISSTVIMGEALISVEESKVNRKQLESKIVDAGYRIRH